MNGLIPNLDKGTITGQCLIDGKDISQTGLFDLSFTTSTILQDTDAQFIGLTVGEDIAFSLENDCVPQDKIEAGGRPLGQGAGFGRFAQAGSPELVGRTRAAGGPGWGLG